MPELAAVYSIGLLACLSLTGLFLFLWSQRRKSPEFLTLNSNLRKVDLYWSENFDQIVHWTGNLEEREQASSRKTIVTTGLLLSLLSWAGVFFLLIVMLSYRFFARSRMERLLFASPLSQNAGLTGDEIRTWLAAAGFQV